jgi:hypothetical protein
VAPKRNPELAPKKQARMSGKRAHSPVAAPQQAVESGWQASQSVWEKQPEAKEYASSSGNLLSSITSL